MKEIGGHHDESITSVVFLKNDGNKLLTNSSDGTMKLLDIRMEKVLKRFEDSEILPVGSYKRSKAQISFCTRLAIVLT